MRVVTFGEIMLRLAPNGYYRFFQNDQLQATFGGSEANVAVSLAQWGIDTRYVTKLPAHAIGQAAIDSLRYFGVDTSYIVRGGERVGIYFNEKGASQRGGLCIYDRAGSAIQTSSPSDFDWDKILDGVNVFHFCGITPALGDNLIETCRAACEAARRKGILISIDTNYRSKLWSWEAAGKAMKELCGYADVLITNPGDSMGMFGIVPEADNFRLAEPSQEGCRSIAIQLKAMFPKLKRIALTKRTSVSASENTMGGMLYDGESFSFAREYRMVIVDRVGGGDSFGAGIIYALLNGFSAQDMIEYAVAASVLKHSVEGDYNRVTSGEVAQLAGGNTIGRVQR